MKKYLFIIALLYSNLLLANSEIEKQQCIENSKSKEDFEKCNEIGKVLPPVLSENEKKRLYDEKKVAISHVNEVKDCIAKSYTSNELKKCIYKHEETKQIANKSIKKEQINKVSKINDDKVFSTKNVPIEESYEKTSKKNVVSKTNNVQKTKTKSNSSKKITKSKKQVENKKSTETLEEKNKTQSTNLKMLF